LLSVQRLVVSLPPQPFVPLPVSFLPLLPLDVFVLPLLSLSVSSLPLLLLLVILLKSEHHPLPSFVVVLPPLPLPLRFELLLPLLYHLELHPDRNYVHPAKEQFPHRLSSWNCSLEQSLQLVLGLESLLFLPDYSFQSLPPTFALLWYHPPVLVSINNRGT